MSNKTNNKKKKRPYDKTDTQNYFYAMMDLQKNVMTIADFFAKSGDGYFTYRELRDSWVSLMEACHGDTTTSSVYEELTRRIEAGEDVNYEKQ